MQNLVASLPFVTIILPIRNEAYFIDRCLHMVFAQDYPHQFFEILVVDGMSTDDTRKIVSCLQMRHKHLFTLNNRAQIVSPALNLAIQKARGEYIIRLDGHTLIASNYVRKCVEILQRTQAENVGGRMNAVGESYTGEVIAAATSTPFGVGGARFHYSEKEEWVDTVYMGAWPKSVFQKVGLFDEELVRNQDDEFNYRLRKMGGRILLSPEIKSQYYNRSSLRSLWRQYFQYGYWKVRVLQKHPRQMSLRQFIPPLFAASLGIAFLLAFFIPFGRLLLALSAGLYLGANLLASVWTASRRGWAYLPMLPIVFAILHLSYGTGFLTGLVKFARRWGDKTGKVPSW